MFRRSVSLVHQIKHEIRARIELDGYRDTLGQLPSETQLSEVYGVSRATVREALAMLAREGVIVRRHGIGTFVNSHLPGLKTSAIENVEFEDMITQQGYEARVEVLRTSIAPAGVLAQKLGVDEDEELFFVDKIFFADSTPVIHCRNAIPLKFAVEKDGHALLDVQTARLPIYRVLQEHCQQDVLYQLSHMRAATADESLAEELACPTHHPLLCIEEIGFNEAQEPVLYCLEFHRSDIIRFDTIRCVVRPFSWEQDS